MGRQDAAVELYYDGEWQTAPAYVRDPITITRGRGDETSEPTPSTASLTLDNRTGEYNPRNASSPLFGLVGRNTPIRVRIVPPTLNTNPYFETDASSWTVAGGTIARSTAQFHQGVASLLLTPDGVSAVAEARAALVTAAVGSTYQATAWVRCAVARNVNIDIDWYTSATAFISTSSQSTAVAANTWTQITATFTAVPTTGKARIVVGMSGTPAGSNLLYIDEATLAVAPDQRFYGEVSSWKPGRTVDFNPATGKGDAWTEDESAGVLRRLGQGADPLASPLRRAILAANPTAYWPLEDADGALSAASAVNAVGDMQPFGFSRFTAPGTGVPVAAAGLPKFGTGNGIPGSAPVVDLAQGGVLTGSVPGGTTVGWRIEFVLVAPRDKADANTPIQWTTNGTWPNWEIQIESTGIFATFGLSPTSGASGTATATFNIFDGQPHHYQVEAFQSGGNLDARIYVDDLQVATYTVLAGSPGSITNVVVNPLEEVNGAPGTPVIGHVAAWNPSVGLSTSAVAMLGHAGETSGARFQRLCDEEGVPATVVGDVTAMQPMGPQRTGVDLAGQLAEIERTDGGLIYEPRDGLGLVLRSVVDLYNQPTTLTVDWSAYQVAPPFNPVVDDQGTRNDVAAKSSTSGAEARAVLEDGPMSVQPPPVGVGRYGTTLDVNPASDATLADLAGWALHKGTVDELRVSRVTVDLVASPGLAAATTAVDIGDRILVTGMPADMGDDEVSLIVLGYTEVIGSHTRTITFNAAPASVYDVATVDGEPRWAMDGGTLAASVTSTGSSLSLAWPADSGGWTTKAEDFPLDLRVGGERVTVSAISGTSSPQTATVTARGLNGVQRAWPAGTEVDVWLPAVVALG